MYLSSTSNSAAIKTQTFPHKGSRVFKATRPTEHTQGLFDSGRDYAGKGHPQQQDTFSYRTGYHDPASGKNVSRTRSTGSNGSSSGTPTSPSVSSPLSRTSSVGSSNGERPGSTIAHQAAVILRNSPQPVYHARVEKNFSSKKPSGQHVHATSRSPKNTKPFNHKEVLEQMEKAFREAKQAIEAGHGKVFDLNEHGPAVVFEPFDWEAFWAARMMKNL